MSLTVSHGECIIDWLPNQSLLNHCSVPVLLGPISGCTRSLLDNLASPHDDGPNLGLSAVMDIVVWLRSLGLGKYEAIFRENDINETVPPSLTHENLKELGLASFGHGLKLLDAIAALRSISSVQARCSYVGRAGQ